MKKIVCGVCSMILACSMYGSSVAYGEDVVGGEVGDYNQEVKATYTETENGKPVYSVDIQWGSMDFDYKAASKMWNPTTHKYDGTDIPSTWDYKGNNNISVTNHSNAAVDVTLSGNPIANKFNDTATFKFFNTEESPSEITKTKIRAAKEGDSQTEGELKLEAVLNILGNMKSSESTTPETIGTVTINVAASVE